MKRLGSLPTIKDISGAFGDVGTLVPLAGSLVVVNGLAATPVFLSVGLFYLAAGLYFGIPMSVQPLKVVSTVAIAAALPPTTIAAAGLLMAVALLGLGLTGTSRWLERVPVPVIKGIQLSIGLLLMKSGFNLMSRGQLTDGGTEQYITMGNLALPVGVLLGGVFLLLILVLLRQERIPASIVLLALGVLAGVALAPAPPNLIWGPALPASAQLSLPSFDDFALALGLLVIPQIPLTLGNAVITTTDVARAYFGERAHRVTPQRLCLSMGLANLVSSLVGGMPMCHGAGGLTAHVRFGANTLWANITIGGLCVAAALVLGQSLVSLFNLVPFAIFGALLFYVGWRHLQLVQRLRTGADRLIVLVVSLVSVIFTNLALGVALGLLVAWGAQRRQRPVPVAAEDF